MVGELEVVTPPIEVLQDVVDHSNLVCPVVGCGKKMRNASAVRMHCVKLHGIGRLEKSKGKNVVYACPVLGCPRHVKDKRQHFFKVLYRLKLHFRHVHSEKKFRCETCGNGYGSLENKNRHQLNCPPSLFYCSCGAYYCSTKAVLSHVQQKGEGHVLVGDMPPSNEKKEKVSPTTGSTILPGYLFLLPKQSTSPTVQLTSAKQSTLPQQSTSGNNHVPILPKIKPVKPPQAEEVYKPLPEVMKDLLGVETVVLKLNNNVDHTAVQTDVKKAKKRKSSLTRYDRIIKYLCSEEAQAALSDPELLKMTLSQQYLKQLNKKAKHPVKTIPQDVQAKINKTMQTLTSVSETFQNMLNQNVEQSFDSHQPSFLQLLNTTETQTDCLPWLNQAWTQTNNFNYPVLIDKSVQLAEDFSKNPINTQDKSIQLDDIWKNTSDKSVQLDQFIGNSLTPYIDSTNTSTQTCLKNNDWCDFNFLFNNNEQNTSSSTQADGTFALNKKDESSQSSLDNHVDFSATSNFGTQTFDQQANTFVIAEGQQAQNCIGTSTLESFAMQTFQLPATAKESFGTQTLEIGSPDTDTFGTQTLDVMSANTSAGTQTSECIKDVLMNGEKRKTTETQTTVSFNEFLESFASEEFWQDGI